MEDKMSAAEQQATNAALATLAATGNSYALGQLWETNRGLIRSMFWKWYPHHKSLADQHGVTADDFEQEGFFAVQYAALRPGGWRVLYVACPSHAAADTARLIQRPPAKIC